MPRTGRCPYRVGHARPPDQPTEGDHVITLDLLAELSALAYLLVLALAAFDVVVPVLPSETAVILGGVLAWQGRLHPVPLVLAASVGAIAGDHLSYSIGRWTQRGRPQPGHHRHRRLGKAERLQVWAGRQLERRGPSLLIVARFIPGGRTASTFMAGRTAYPLRRFTPATVAAGILWASFATMLGYVGGHAFHEQTLLATGLGLVLAVAFATLVELVMSWRERRRAATAAVEGEAGAGAGELPGDLADDSLVA
jgi:membrane protein DedA with SNARE-associated domain